MVKKKRPVDQNPDNGSSTESCDETKSNNAINSAIENSCSHIAKAVDGQKLRKKFKTFDFTTFWCTECPKPTPDIMLDGEYDLSLWLCLKCGTHLCGRTLNKHALLHYQTPRSDLHALAVNTTTWEIWCYFCDKTVNVMSKPKLQECIDIVKKEVMKQNSDSPKEINNIEDKIISTFDALRPYMGNNSTVSKAANKSDVKLADNKKDFKIELVKEPSPTPEVLPRVRGLSNLGNTCFFNAVLQCLAQTPYLLDVLKESSQKGEKFQLPGGALKIKGEPETILPPINGDLNAWGNLTEALAETLEELQSPSAGVFTPRSLLQHLTHKWPQFDGGDQHDSHELLRHLLESVRSEDLRRYQYVVLKSLGYSTKVDPHTVEGVIKQKIKLYGQQAADRILRPEPVFRGFLVSTLTCQDCYHTSSRHESFLDISLPVCTEKPQPPIRRKASPEPGNYSSPAGMTKNQSKKEKEREKKAKRAAKNQKTKLNLSFDDNAASGDTTNTKVKHGSSSSSSDSNELSDADVEDNLTDDTVPKHINHSNVIVCDANGNSTVLDKSVTSPIDPEKRDDSPENPHKNDPDVERPVSRFDFVPDMPIENSVENPNNILVELSISAEGVANLVKNRRDSEIKIETLIDKLVLNDDDNDNCGERKTEKGNKQQNRRQRTYSHADWSTTIGQRYQCEDGELSIQSCFNNFTAVELMTGNNKVCCETCTLAINGKDGKSVNTNATKQFLISSPPAVLILHLKRFQVGPRCIFKKMAKHVTFPLVLDIAPFCGSKVKKLPNIKPHQKNLLYSLYGIVEHSGGMHGGHYVAYVKVRAKFPTTDTRWEFLPKGSKAELDQNDEQRVRLEQALARDRAREMMMSAKQNDSDDSISSSSSSGAEEEGAVGYTQESIDPSSVTSPPGKWYYVSDSRVQETKEEDVLKAQAYLLFYERIF